MKTLTMIKLVAVFIGLLFVLSNIFVSLKSPSKIVEENITIIVK